MSKLLFLLVVLFTISSFSQIEFEKGYFITNNDEKINCFIKNMDWKKNPMTFSHKTEKKSDTTIINDIKNVKEFSINGKNKYVRKTVNIDRSGDKIGFLSKEKNPVFKKETLFLKILVEGKATLYSYKENHLSRYFYDLDKNSLEQLVFKRYLKPGTDIILNNNYFKQQLFNKLKCNSKESVKKINTLRYVTKDLTRFFIKYNECSTPNYTNIFEKSKKDLFNLTLRPRLNNSSLSIENSITTSNFLRNFNNINFESQVNIGIGVELEFILSYNKNKWAIILEPTYRNFKSEKNITIDNVLEELINIKTNYNSIELPVGLRHYFFLNKNSKLFTNISYLFDINLGNSTIDIIREDGTTFSSLNVKTNGNLVLGIGYKFKEKYSIEVRFYTKKNILASESAWNSNYKNTSIILGYTLF